MPPHLTDHARENRAGPARCATVARERRPRSRVHELHIGRRHVLSFAGELDLATTATLDRAIAVAIERGAAQVWVDLRHTSFMDSSGVHCLLRARRTLAQLNRGFAVICDGDPVRRVLSITGADRAIATYPDRAAAHAAA